MSGFRLERLLPFAIIAAAAVLFASNFMTTFEFIPPGGEALDEQTAADIHSYAPAILAAFAVIAMFVALGTGSKPAAMAVAACGITALLLFLLIILPDAGQIGTLDDPRQSFFTTEAVPQAGFWLALIGALGLAVAGAALATLTPEQLAVGERLTAWRQRRRNAEEEDEKARPESEDEAKPAPKRRRREDAEERSERVKDRVERVRKAARRRGD